MPSNAAARQLREKIATFGLEPVAAFAYAIVLVLGHVNNPRPASLALDLCACLLAGISGRWALPACVGVLAVLAADVALPSSWATANELAFLIPVVGLGARGRPRASALFTGVGIVLLATESLVQSASPQRAVPTLGFWAALTSIAWGGGVQLAAWQRNHHQAAQQALTAQRQELARDLHDTVAHQLTLMTWRAELARIRQQATAEDLAFFASTASQCSNDLRAMLALMNDADNTTESTPTLPTLAEILHRFVSQLEAHGFHARTSIEGTPDAIPGPVLTALDKITTEATNNIVRHGSSTAAATCLVNITAHDIQLLFINMIAPQHSVSTTPHLGLAGIKARAESLGGQVHAQPAGEHWITQVELPLNRSPHIEAP